MPDHQQPPLRPFWAIVFTIAACPVGLILAVLAHYFLYASWQQALGWWAVMAYLATAFAWSALEWPTRNAAVRGHNAFVIIAISVFATATVTGESYSEFPRWGTITLIVAAIIGYSVMGICGVRNSVKWLRGGIPGNSQHSSAMTPDE
jgi:hypothetical protein